MQTCAAPRSRNRTTKTGPIHPDRWPKPDSARQKKQQNLRKPCTYYRHQPQNTTFFRPLTSFWMPNHPKGSGPQGWNSIS